MAQKVLQTDLSMGMSAVSGAHSSKPPPMPEDHDGLKYVIPDSITPQLDTRYTLRGKNGNDVQVPLRCWGAWSRGDTSTFHWSDDELPALQAAWKKCLENGITFVDTTQVYGSGKSEEILADLIHNHRPGVDRSKIIVQTKWLPNVTDQGKNVLHPVDAPFKQLQKTLDRMKLTHIDCYLVHGHIHISSIKQVAKGLAKCVEEGLTKTVGVANYSHGIPLATDQCEYSIIRRMPETEGMLEACRENDIVFQSYSSIAQGRLSGKYGRDNPPPKQYRFSSYNMEHVEPCLEVQRKLAEK
ncbi:Aldo/keto reductase [Xylaria longipes]|nr:Aldo/keto reductase [Xylaria longipes]